jgi:hypothetical protein
VGRKPYIEREVGKIKESKQKRIDTRTGDIRVESFINGKRNLEFDHAIWSPFIIQPLMEGFDWQLVNRMKLKPKANLWIDVYRKLG